jgi:hypothetical protein
MLILNIFILDYNIIKINSFSKINFLNLKLKNIIKLIFGIELIIY